MKRYKVVMLALSLALLAAVVYFSNPFVLASLVAKSDYRFLVIGLLLSFVSVTFGVMKWKVLLGNISTRELFPVQVLGFTVSNFTPGKVGEPAKAVVLKIVKGVPISSSLSSIVWERIMDVIILILFSLIAISSLSLNSSFLWAGTASIAIFFALIILSFVILYKKNIGKKIFCFIRKFPILKKLPDNFMDLFYKVKIEKVKILKCLAATATAWTLVGLVLYVSLRAFGVDLNPIIAISIVALSVVIGIASSLPGGVGTTEIAMIFLLSTIGIDSSIATAATLIFRLLTLWFVNIMGGLSFVYLGKKFDIKNIIS